MNNFSQLFQGAVDLRVLLLPHDLIELCLNLRDKLPNGLVSLESATIARGDRLDVSEIVFVVDGGLGLIFTQGLDLLITNCTVFKGSGPRQS